MKRFISALFISVLFQNVCLASGKAPRANASVASATSPSSSHLTAGVAIPILVDPGETALGLNFGWLTEAGSKLYVGADIGIHFWGKALGYTESLTGLQLLPTVVYHLKGSSKLTPYIGLSAGPYLYVSKPAGWPTGIDFALLFRPGLNWSITDSFVLNLEAKYGELGGALLVMPVASVAFTL